MPAKAWTNSAEVEEVLEQVTREATGRPLETSEVLDLKSGQVHGDMKMEDLAKSGLVLVANPSTSVSEMDQLRMIQVGITCAHGATY